MRLRHHSLSWAAAMEVEQEVEQERLQAPTLSPQRASLSERSRQSSLSERSRTADDECSVCYELLCEPVRWPGAADSCSAEREPPLPRREQPDAETKSGNRCLFIRGRREERVVDVLSSPPY